MFGIEIGPTNSPPIASKHFPSLVRTFKNYRTHQMIALWWFFLSSKFSTWVQRIWFFCDGPRRWPAMVEFWPIIFLCATFETCRFYFLKEHITRFQKSIYSLAIIRTDLKLQPQIELISIFRWFFDFATSASKNPENPTKILKMFGIEIGRSSSPPIASKHFP